jgi:hypothetical protein
MLLIARGGTDEAAAILNYQRGNLGAKIGDTCLIELLPLPSPQTSVWNYGRWSALPWLRSRAEYVSFCRQRRARELAEKVRLYHPKLVICYGTTLAPNDSLLPTWSHLASGNFQQAVLGRKVLLERHSGHTAFFVTKHPAAPELRSRTAEYFREIGGIIRSKL